MHEVKQWASVFSVIYQFPVAN